MDKKLLVVGIIVVLVLGAPFVMKMADQKEGAPSTSAQDSNATASTIDAPGTSQNSDPNVPAIVSMQPDNGASDVSLTLTALVVTFDRPMGGGFSWTGGGDQFPETTGEPYWSTDRKTCYLPVKLKAGWSYRLGLNSKSFKNFTSEQGVPLTPVVWTFTTAS